VGFGALIGLRLAMNDHLLSFVVRPVEVISPTSAGRFVMSRALAIFKMFIGSRRLYSIACVSCLTAAFALRFGDWGHPGATPYPKNHSPLSRDTPSQKLCGFHRPARFS
jgi:hypothetical protein